MGVVSLRRELPAAAAACSFRAQSSPVRLHLPPPSEAARIAEMDQKMKRRDPVTLFLSVSFRKPRIGMGSEWLATSTGEESHLRNLEPRRPIATCGTVKVPSGTSER